MTYFGDEIVICLSIICVCVCGLLQQVSNWRPEMMEIEDQAKQVHKTLLNELFASL